MVTPPERVSQQGRLGARSTAGRRASPSPSSRWLSCSPSRGCSSCARAPAHHRPSRTASAGRTARSRRGRDGTVTLVGDFGAVASGNAGGSEHLPAGETVNSAALPESAYDAGTRTETTYGGAGPSVKLQRTVGAWPPVWRLSTPGPLQYQGLAAIVRTAVDDGDESVGIKPLKEGDAARLARRDDPGGQRASTSSSTSSAASSPGTATARSPSRPRWTGSRRRPRARPGRWTRRPVRP